MSDLKYILKDFSETEVATFKDELSSIFLRLDSKNCIFKFRYKSNLESAYPIFELIGDYIQDKNVDNILDSFARDLLLLLQSSGGYKSSSELFRVDYCINLVKTALQIYIGKLEAEKTHDLNAQEIICRCAKVDKSMLRQSFLNAKGRRNDLIKQTNMTSFCGSCKNLVDSLFVSLESEFKFLAGEKVDHWVSKIITMGSEFHVQPNDKLVINIVSVDIPKVQVLVAEYDQELITRSDITKNLTHLFDGQLPFRTEIEFTFSV